MNMLLKILKILIASLIGILLLTDSMVLTTNALFSLSFNLMPLVLEIIS